VLTPPFAPQVDLEDIGAGPLLECSCADSISAVDLIVFHTSLLEVDSCTLRFKVLLYKLMYCNCYITMFIHSSAIYLMCYQSSTLLLSVHHVLFSYAFICWIDICDDVSK
jgi:hypothetical protein